MASRTDDMFKTKFKSLYSQECNEDISCSSSTSNDEEIVKSEFCNRNPEIRKRDCKSKRKQSECKNTSNLLFKFGEKSPILNGESSKKTPKSPILEVIHNTNLLKDISDVSNTVSCLNFNINNSQNRKLLHKSSVSNKIRKNIFDTNLGSIKTKLCDFISKEAIQNGLIKGKNIDSERQSFYAHNNADSDIENTSPVCKKIKITKRFKSLCQDSKLNVMDRVKSYLDSHLSPESTSLSLIIEELTPESTGGSDKFKSLTSISDNTVKDVEGTGRYAKIKLRRCKNKKDGLAFRLDNLLRKLNSNFNLWSQEKYLKGNTNFLTPESKYLLFYVKSVRVKYGCHLLVADHENDDCYVIIINNQYVIGSILINSILRLYEPYNILKINNFNLAINIYKYDYYLP